MIEEKKILNQRASTRPPLKVKPGSGSFCNIYSYYICYMTYILAQANNPPLTAYEEQFCAFYALSVLRIVSI